MKTITTKLVIVGPVPAGVDGANVAISCKNLTNAPADNTQTLTASFGTVNPLETPLNFGLQAGPVYGASGLVTPGSSCRITAVTRGNVTSPANLGLGNFSITVGGKSVSVNESIVFPSSTTIGSNSATTVGNGDGFLPIFNNTEVVVTLTYPQITIKKTISGDERTAGFSYPMSIACNGGVSKGFIAGLIGTDSVKNTSAWNTTDAQQLLLPGGAGWYVSLKILDTRVPGDYITVRVYDARTTENQRVAGTAELFLAGAPSAAYIGNAAFFANYSATMVNDWAGLKLNEIVALVNNVSGSNSILSPVGAPGFTGTFTLKGAAPGNEIVVSNAHFPGLTNGSQCEVTELNSNGATAISYTSTTTSASGKGTASGVQNGTRWQSALTSMHESITVNNAFLGDLVISKVVTGDSKSNISTFEISVACDKGGPKDTFLLKDRQSKVYNNIATGTNCLVTETKSDGAVASYSDNVGDNTTDGRVTIKQRGNGCAQVGAPTPALPGGPAPVTSFDDCWASVIITNDYNPPATTEAPAAAPATAAPATAAPAVTPAPATPVEATATFTG